MGDLTANISRYEIECKCGDCGFDTIDYQTVMIWQDVCDYFLHIKRGVKALEMINVLIILKVNSKKWDLCQLLWETLLAWRFPQIKATLFKCLHISLQRKE